MKYSKIIFGITSCIFLFTNCIADSKLEEKGILPKGANAEVIVKGLQFTEGPLWLKDENRLIFSDILANTKYSWTKDEGLKVYEKPSFFANGNMLDEKGNLITARHDRTVVRTTKSGKTEVIADKFKNKKLNSPNDLALYKDGSIYFTDPHFGLIGYGAKKAPEEQPYRGIYRLEPGGELTRVGQELEIPNGLSFSPDYKILYVSNTADGNIYKYDVLENGQLRNIRLFVVQSIPDGANPMADGLKVDKKGNVYAASAFGVSIYSASGDYIGSIKLHSAASNLNFGEIDNKTLFITSADKVYKIKTKIGR
jgi:gluconolactonase